MTTTKLEPCPFCGGEAEIVAPRYEVVDGRGWFVSCKHRAGAPAHETPTQERVAFSYGSSREEAIAAWNRRALPLPADLEEWEKLARTIALAAAGQVNDNAEARSVETLVSAAILSLVRELAEARKAREWLPIKSAPKGEEVLIAYWRWRNSMSPGSIVVQSARQTEFYSEGIWSWVVSDNKHGPFPIRGWSEGDIIGWQPLPSAPSSEAETSKETTNVR